MASASVYTAVLAAAQSSEHSEHSILLPEPADLIWGSLCFVVIAVVLIKYALPKFTAILDERTAKIQAGLDFAEQAKSDRTRTQKEAAELVEGARRDAAALRDKAHGEAERILSQARTDAEGEADKALAPPSASLKLKPVRPVKLNAVKSACWQPKLPKSYCVPSCRIPRRQPV